MYPKQKKSYYKIAEKQRIALCIMTAVVIATTTIAAANFKSAIRAHNHAEACQQELMETISRADSLDYMLEELKAATFSRIMKGEY